MEMIVQSLIRSMIFIFLAPCLDVPIIAVSIKLLLGGWEVW